MIIEIKPPLGKTGRFNRTVAALAALHFLVVIASKDPAPDV